MTKPVQIPRYSVQRDDNGSYLRLDQEGSLVGYLDHLTDKEASLLQVREMLEARAKEWGTAAFTLSHGKLTRFGVALKCRDELLSLAATLGNQGK